MDRGKLAICACMLTAMLSQIPVSSGNLESIISGYTWEGTYEFFDGQAIGGGAWRCVWLGYGFGEVSDGKLWLSPAVSRKVGETHSSLVASEFTLDSTWDFSVISATDRQLRNRSPNPWEVAWIMADMKEDGSTGLYFLLKPNGVELGAYRHHGLEQQFLYTNHSPVLELGREYEYRLAKEDGWIQAFVDGDLVAEAPLNSIDTRDLGDRIGLYTEDAAVHFGEVSIYQPVSPSSLGLDVYRDSTRILSTTGTTTGDGLVGFRLKNSTEGCYSSVVRFVEVPGYEWDGKTPENGFCK
jgi:hypothetical protein